MFIVLDYSVTDKLSKIVYISNDYENALAHLIDLSSDLIKQHTENKSCIISKDVIYIYEYQAGYISSCTKLSHILQLVSYEGDITQVYEEQDTPQE